MGDPDEMKPGRGEFHEFPYSCVCRKRFKTISDENNEEQGSLLSGANSESQSEWENKGQSSMQSLKDSGEGELVTLGNTKDE